MLRIRIRVAGRRRLRRRRMTVAVGCVGCWWLAEVCRRLRFLSHHEFRGNGWINILVQLEPDAAAPRSDENLDGNFSLCLGTVVEIDDGMHALDHLPLHHRLPRKPRIEIHDIGFQPFVMEGSLDPADKFSRDLL